MPSDIDIIRMEATNKYFAQIKFVDNVDNVDSVVTNPSDTNPLPRMKLYVNGVETPHTDGTSYHSSIRVLLLMWLPLTMTDTSLCMA